MGLSIKQGSCQARLSIKLDRPSNGAVSQTGLSIKWDYQSYGAVNQMGVVMSEAVNQRDVNRSAVSQ